MTLSLLKEEALKLDKMERLVFAQFIIDSVINEKEEDSVNKLTEEHLAELEKRSAKFLTGNAKTFSWEEVKNNMLSKRK